MRPLVAVAAACMIVVAALADNPPPQVIRSGRAVRVVLPQWLLKLEPVRKQLATALTTTFLIKGKERRAMLEVRYDLWDEVYHVKRTENGRTNEVRIAEAELEQWWRTPVELGDMDTGRFELTLEVLPFSAAEEKDAREWLLKSRLSGGLASGRSPSSRAVGAMIGTTIAARPIATYRWPVDLGASK